MDLSQWLIWILVGAVAGILADSVVKGVKIGLIGAIIVGILGAIVGGWLMNYFHINLGTGIISEIIIAFIGAVILLLVLLVIRKWF